MIGKLLAPELNELIRQRNFAQLRQIFCDFPAPDIAEIFVDVKPDDEVVLLRLLPTAVLQPFWPDRMRSRPLRQHLPQPPILLIANRANIIVNFYELRSQQILISQPYQVSPYNCIRCL